MNCFDRSFLLDKTCILLNDAHSIFKDLGPVALASSPMFLRTANPDQIRFRIAKARMWNAEEATNDIHLLEGGWRDTEYYIFSFRHPDHGEPDSRDLDRAFLERDYYWTGGTVAAYAIQFAVQAGAKNIFLVGCDCASIRGSDYVAPMQMALRHKRWVQGEDFAPSVRDRGKTWKKRKRTQDEDYSNVYLRSILLLKELVKKKFRVPIYTLTPFVGVRDFDYQYRYFMDNKFLRAFRDGKER